MVAYVVRGPARRALRRHRRKPGSGPSGNARGLAKIGREPLGLVMQRGDEQELEAQVFEIDGVHLRLPT
ncbi:hypothetical protein Sme01_74500 [Sphaerisporangium melleum]|uniref:Uncharacterized protein n=1 Tax=Sphaerisporangium melleum TaxID=321316 RepID=A0A917VWE6_9ACTN|nr:hypothetical protein [Sphaerisporangium melleum]GGL21080.1 hypothetical protein GCM10007964_73810 [Sphaerisporangium melleum]GII74974.1 hypothetical protein Sme01_74500 [Sphaerisporangium melleum]